MIRENTRRSVWAACATFLIVSGLLLLVAGDLRMSSTDETGNTTTIAPPPITPALSAVARAQKAMAAGNYGTAEMELRRARHALERMMLSRHEPRGANASVDDVRVGAVRKAIAKQSN